MIPSPNSAREICIALMLYIFYVYHLFHIFRLHGMCVCVCVCVCGWEFGGGCGGLAAITCGVGMCGIHLHHNRTLFCNLCMFNSYGQKFKPFICLW